MILVGIDDTDVLGSLGTNQLARAIVRAAAPRWRCLRIVRHQLLDDPRIPYTSKNGSASIAFETPADDPPQSRAAADDVRALTEICRQVMRAWFIPGSDPGLCVTAEVPEAVTQFGLRCQRAVVTQAEARELAAVHGLHLEGLGGTDGGVIGALAAVGLAIGGDDGRIVQLAEWPDDLSGVQSIPDLQARGVEVRELDSEVVLHTGMVDVGKHLRPNRRAGRSVLFVRRTSAAAVPEFQAVKLP